MSKVSAFAERDYERTLFEEDEDEDDDEDDDDEKEELNHVSPSMTTTMMMMKTMISMIVQTAKTKPKESQGS